MNNKFKRDFYFVDSYNKDIIVGFTKIKKGININGIKNNNRTIIIISDI